MTQTGPNLPLPAGTLDTVVRWVAPQAQMREVVRWSKYLADGCRPQDTLTHSFSLALLANSVLPALHERRAFRQTLVLMACLEHDIGEGVLKMDTLYIDKNAATEAAECAAYFQARGKHLDEMVSDAYLLQFVGKRDIIALLPDGIREQAEAVEKAYGNEALVFEGLERFDYLLYALEQHLAKRGPRIVVQTIRNQLPHLNRLAIDLPGFRDVLWTKELEDWCNAFLKQYEGQYIEQKGET